ncbi:MAG TPA: phosphatase PAP2 family protein [Acidimicrobiia bacterium]|nr:phosphatase PAP2 family protein [Acidimicrobiia bacterium]
MRAVRHAPGLLPLRWYDSWRERTTPNAIVAADLNLFHWVARKHWPIGDRLLPGLSRAANNSFLWKAIAIAIGLAGGRFDRRAALRGMVSIALASALTNIPGKLISRRTRPDLEVVPVVRRLARLPSSTSFPSGHAASAFAFATGAAIERPVLAPILFPLAAVVAYSRVYTGVHYPSDVVAGAALGAGFAAATRRWWPVASDEPAEAGANTTRLEDRPGSSGQGLVVIVNPNAGGALDSEPAELIADGLPEAEIIEPDEAEDLGEILEKAAAGSAVLGIAGGDGSVNAAAAVAHRYGEPLVIFPAGTLNHFARDLGLEDFDDTIQAVKQGHTVAVDMAMIDGQGFVNAASFGSYVDLVDARERLEKRIGKWPAVLFASIVLMWRGRPVSVEIDGRRERVWMVFIGNCVYEPGGLAPHWRENLDDGQLDIRLVDGSRPFARLRLAWALLTGTLGRSPVYRTYQTSGPVRVRSLQGRPLRLARDGETFNASAEEFTIEKAAEPLIVFVPRAD